MQAKWTRGSKLRWAIERRTKRATFTTVPRNGDLVRFRSCQVDATASHSQHATRGSRRWASLRKRVGLQDSLDRSRHDEAPNRSDAGADSRRRSSNAVDFLPEICRLESYLRAVLSAHWNQLPSRAGLKPEIVDYFGRWKNRGVAHMQVRFYKLAIEEDVEASNRL